MTDALTKRVSTQPFEKQALTVLGRLRASLAAAINAIPGNVSRATDLQRAARIDMNLSWRLLKVARAADPLSAGPHVPGPAYIRTFLKAAARAGVRSALLEAVEAAAEEFERLVKKHAGDRLTFNSMVSGLLGNEDADQFNLQQRRAAFRANRHLWGLQATTQVRCAFLNVGDDPAKVTLALLDGYIDLRQLRRSAPLTVSRALVTDDADTLLPVRSRPIAPEGAGEHGLALMPEFCSQPPPRLREVRAAGGYLTGELVSPGVGKEGAITCFTGWWAQDAVPRYRSEGDQCASLMTMVRVPCEAVTFCVLVRRGLLANLELKLAVYSDHRAELPYPNGDCRMEKLLLPDEVVTHVGRGAQALCTPDVPRLAEMVQYVFDRLGWDGEQFEAYRCRIAYPIMPSTIEISTELPAAPAEKGPAPSVDGHAAPAFPKVPHPPL